MRLRALLENHTLGLRLLGGEAELDRAVRGVMTTDLRDPSRYLSGGELVLTGLVWHREPADSERFVRILARAGVAALAAGEAERGPIPADLVAACARHRLPLFLVDEKVAFATITEHVVRRVSAERAGDLAAVVDRHRRLMTGGSAEGGPEVLLDLLGSDLDLRGWVLSPTGRLIAGGPSELPEATRAVLAGEHLARASGGRPGPYRLPLAERTYSLFPVHDVRLAETRESALADWLLVVEADATEWPAERLDLLRGITQLIAAGRDRRDAARAVRRQLAAEILELLQGRASPAELAARLRVTAPVLLPGSDQGSPHWQVVVARVEWQAAEGSEAGGSSPQPTGGLSQALLEEILIDPRTTSGAPVAVAHTDTEAVAFVPLPETGGTEERPAIRSDSLARTVGGPLARGLASDGRLSIGVSAAVHSSEGIRGALEEARHARRVAAARAGRVCVAGHEELASHVLLLPFVPDDVRRAFTARLLDPLREYDRRHRAELVSTLEAFLECDGSWTRCSSRLHLHVNTLRYRVGRIEQLTGRDLSRLEDKLDFFLALRMS
ncbi:PucR family transcriptional regulator [Streptomyces sp. TP-A0874]|uniref:PucR family transcriptional regulator n=1 Tax=Streptomyces sp. TP-A0874 TaxID=549819 RepID=UPI000853381A|nr:PucR family transcriptional regulator ligand-binding domain-containing protein [Streptomyces sp. TP-A0874]